MFEITKETSIIIFEIMISIIVYALVGVDLFINAPMNGVYHLPGKWSKDDTILYGFRATLLFLILMTYFCRLSLTTGIIFIVIYYLFFGM